MRCLLVTILLSCTLSSASAGMITYNGLRVSSLGSTLQTTLPEFNSSLGTLTGVELTLI